MLLIYALYSYTIGNKKVGFRSEKGLKSSKVEMLPAVDLFKCKKNIHSSLSKYVGNMQCTRVQMSICIISFQRKE